MNNKYGINCGKSMSAVIIYLCPLFIDDSCSIGGSHHLWKETMCMCDLRSDFCHYFVIKMCWLIRNGQPWTLCPMVIIMLSLSFDNAKRKFALNHNFWENMTFHVLLSECWNTLRSRMVNLCFVATDCVAFDYSISHIYIRSCVACVCVCVYCFWVDNR